MQGKYCLFVFYPQSTSKRQFTHKGASIYSESRSKEKGIYMRPTNQAEGEFQIQGIFLKSY